MKKKLKSFIFTLMLILASLSLVACGNTKDKEENKPVEDIEDKEDDKDTSKDDDKKEEETEEEKPEDKEDPEEDKKDPEEEKPEDMEEPEEEKPEDKEEPEEEKEVSFNQDKTNILIGEINNRNGGKIEITEDNNDSGKPIDLNYLQAVARFENPDAFGWVVKYDDNKIGIISHFKAANHDKLVLWGEKAVMEMAPNFSGLKTGSPQEFKEAVEPILSNDMAFPNSQIEYYY